MASTNPARGMRDFLPADVRKREYVIGVIKQVYESYGFEPLETPAVENIETLMGKYGEEGNQLVFKILKRGEKLDESLETGDLKRELADLALRYDLTVPLARVVANNRNDLPKFFKRYQIQPVWRADRPARGRFREFYQCDVDCIGSESILVEAEVISAVLETLTRLGFTDAVIRVNHRKVLSDLLIAAGIPEGDHPSTLVSLDKMDKIGSDGVIAELQEKGICFDSAGLAWSIFRAASDSGNNEELLQEVNHFVEALSGTESTGVAETRQLLQLMSKSGSANVIVDTTLARGLSYYTGTIMELNVDGIGSLGGGGRYDGLIGMFGKEQIPACGFSLGLERILVVMEERGMFPPEIADSTPADVLVTIWSEETFADSLRLANELRSSGLRVTLYPEADKFGKQIKYADQIKVPFVCVLGESEIADGKVTLKNMRSGEQASMTVSEVVATING